MISDASTRAQTNFDAAKELCRIGHRDTDGAPTCTYGGMSSQHGYWLAAKDCSLNHGETCDLRTVCSGSPAETRFRGSDPDPDIMYWVWAVMACRPCADAWNAAHPEQWVSA